MMRYRAAVILLIVFLGGCDSVQDGPTPVSLRIPVTLKIFPWESLILMLGSSLSLQPVTLDERGDPLPPTHPIVFLSRLPNVISVSDSGELRARAMGGTWIVGSTRAASQLLWDSVSVVVRCTAEGPRAVLSPSSASLRVGESFTPTVRLTVCMGQLEETDAFRWRVLDTLVITVDSLSGRSTGRAPGKTFVIVRGTKYPVDLERIPVEVFGDPPR